MRFAHPSALAVLLSLPLPGAAQVTITDGRERPPQWVICDVRAPDRPEMTYYYSPIFQYDYDAERAASKALWPYWESSPVEHNYAVYKAPDCHKYDTRAAAAEWRDSRIAIFTKSVLVTPDYPLLTSSSAVHPGSPPASAEPSRPVAVGSPSVADDTPQVAAANAAAAAAAEAQTRRILADKEAYRALVEKNNAENAAKAEEYRRQVAEQEARNEAIRRSNEEKVALYRACLAGDKAACQRYNAR